MGAVPSSLNRLSFITGFPICSWMSESFCSAVALNLNRPTICFDCKCNAGICSLFFYQLGVQAKQGTCCTCKSCAHQWCWVHYQWLNMWSYVIPHECRGTPLASFRCSAVCHRPQGQWREACCFHQITKHTPLAFLPHLFLFLVQQGISGREDVWGQVSVQSSLSLHLLQLRKV